MKMENKNSTMKKIIVANNVFIALQILMLTLSVGLNFVCDDTKVFITAFTHIAFFVIFNIIVENIVDYGYIRKKYEKICKETSAIRYFQLKRRIFKFARQKQDKTTTTLMIQGLIKILIVLLNIIMMLFMVNFE